MTDVLLFFIFGFQFTIFCLFVFSVDFRSFYYYYFIIIIFVISATNCCYCSQRVCFFCYVNFFCLSVVKVNKIVAWDIMGYEGPSVGKTSIQTR